MKVKIEVMRGYWNKSKVNSSIKWFQGMEGFICMTFALIRNLLLNLHSCRMTSLDLSTSMLTQHNYQSIIMVG
jgi:hypothetical protein